MAIWEEKKMKKKTVPTRHAILMAGIQEEKRQAQLKEAYGITEEVTVVEKKSRTAQLLRVLVNAIFVMMRGHLPGHGARTLLPGQCNILRRIREQWDQNDEKEVFP